jgi:hypothetical protein
MIDVVERATSRRRRNVSFQRSAFSRNAIGETTLPSRLLGLLGNYTEIIFKLTHCIKLTHCVN